MSTVVISRRSREVVFSGNLLKAPPLDRRGRKKWHQRYIVLRANKTLECHKSQKAATTSKPPRRVIDLRECINLELGLEYKDLQHVLCLGTFKRSFFFAAPSDAMMLQWSNVLESVKNATEGETVEVLDIGLRKTQNYNAVHRVKPSASMHRLSTGSAKHLYILGGVPKSTSNLTCIADPRGSPSRAPQGVNEVVPDPPPRTSSLRHSSASSSGSLPRGGTPEQASRFVKFDCGSPVSKATPTTLDLKGSSHTLPSPTSLVSSPARERSRSVSSNHSVSNPSTPTGKFLLFPAKVPPPTSLVAMATIANDLKEQVEERTTEEDHVITGGDHVITGEDHVTKADVPEAREGHPQRVGSGEKGKLQTEPTTTSEPQPGINPSEAKVEPTLNDAQSLLDPSSNGKFLQRVNAFKKRPTLQLGGAPDASILLQSNMKASFRYQKIAMRPEVPIFSKEDGESSEEDTESQGSGGDQGSVVIDEVHLKKVGPNFEAKVSSAQSAHKVVSGSREKVQFRVRANSYSKVTMTTVNQEASRCYPQRVKAPSSPSANDASSPIGKGENESCDAGGPSPLPIQDLEAFPCPVPTPTFERRACYSMNSLNSLDAVEVEPPDMFKGCGKQDDSTKDSPQTALEGCAVDGDRVGDGDLTLSVDRRSVESSDMGYVSGVSPAALHDVKEIPILGRVGSRKIALGRALSGDASKLYVPMVFSGPAGGKDRSLFAVQVCLVESSDSLIKDLILFKALHNYQLVQCDDQEEEDDTGAAMSAADSFTVETSLEDLEFGFGVVSNTQKDVFDHRVREFNFEVRDLFKTTKSFSCDVWIKYSGHITKLPIEVQRTSCG